MHAKPIQTSRRSTRRRVSSAAVAGLLLASIGLAGCGDDDQSADEGSSATTTPVKADNAAFCDGFVETDAYFTSLDGPPDEAKADELLSALADEAPAEISEHVTVVVDETRKSMSEQTETTPAFDDAYAEAGDWVGENCGFEALQLDGKEYEYSGVPKTAPTGTTRISLKNNGTELHEAIVVRINDGVTESLEEIASLPEEEALSKVTMLGQAFAAPGESGSSFANFEEPGSYGVICFIPQGLTPEAAQAAETSGTEPEGAPHFTLGMINEFEVE